MSQEQAEEYYHLMKDSGTLVSSPSVEENNDRQEEKQFGLDEKWDSIEEILRQIIPVYDKTNRVISLGTDLKVRTEGLSLLIQHLIESGNASFSVLDLGSGPGKMTQLLTSLTSSESSAKIRLSVMLDALGPMMNVAMKRNQGSQGVLGVYEAIPIKGLSFESAIAGFAIRDAKNLSKALSEIHRILKDNGYFLIVDLSRPDSRIKRSLIWFYWIALAPMLALFAAGRLGLKFGALAATYNRLPQKSEFLSILRATGFEIVDARFKMMDGVCIILIRKSTT